MTVRSFLSGTVNSLRHANSIVAKPVEPVITSAALAGADATAMSIAITQPSIGMPATSFTATSTPGSVTRTANTSPISFESMALNPNQAYTFTVSSVGANGTGPSTTSSSVSTLDSYILTQTFTSSGNFTVPASATKLAVVAYGGGSGGNGGAGTSSSHTHCGHQTSYGTGGSGGYSSAIAMFKEVTVTPGDIYAVTIGAGGNSGGAGGASSFGNLVTVTGNTVTGNAGVNLNSVSAPTIGNGGSGGVQNVDGDGWPHSGAGSSGNISNTPISLSQNLTGLGVVTYTGTNGGGGGGSFGASGATSNIGAGSGGNVNAVGGVGNVRGAGGGGGGSNNGTGGAGTAGAVYVYVKY